MSSFELVNDIFCRKRLVHKTTCLAFATKSSRTCNKLEFIYGHSSTRTVTSYFTTSTTKNL